MYTIKMIKLFPSLFCVILTWAPYSGGDVERRIIESIKKSLVECGDKNENFGEAIYNKIVKNLHELLLNNGNKHEYRKKYRWGGYKWYQAYCELLFINIYEDNSDNYFEYAYIGQIPMYKLNSTDNLLTAVNFIHNIENEIKNNTIEESCLSPFNSRSNKDIAKQLMPAENDEFIEMVSNCERDEFVGKFSHSITRTIGYFQRVGSNEIADYRIDSPEVTYGKGKLKTDDLLVIYLPENRDIIPFSQDKLDQTVRNRLCGRVTYKYTNNDFIEVQKGDVISIEIINQNLQFLIG